MITTSICLPITLVATWREKRREIMKLAVRSLRVSMHQEPIRRGVGRQYDRTGTAFCIVTTRFSAAEYDTLHFVGSSLRVSVSSLICQVIALWNKSSRRRRGNPYVTNYELHECYWGAAAGVITESLLFWRKKPKTYPVTRQMLL